MCELVLHGLRVGRRTKHQWRTGQQERIQRLLGDTVWTFQVATILIGSDDGAIRWDIETKQHSVNCGYDGLEGGIADHRNYIMGGTSLMWQEKKKASSSSFLDQEELNSNREEKED